MKNLGLFLLVLFFSSSIHAEDLTLELSSEEEVSYQQFSADSPFQLLLLPGDRAHTTSEAILASRMAATSIDVTYPLLHDSYFLESGSFSVSQVPLNDLAEFTAKTYKPGKTLFLFAHGHVSVVALKLMNHLRKNHPEIKLGGLVFLAPYFEGRYIATGEALSHHPELERNNLPIYIFQPSKSSRLYYLKTLLKNFRNWQTPAYARVVHDVRDVFHSWPGLKNETELRQRKLLPTYVREALNLLAQEQPGPIREVSSTEAPEPKARKRGASLQPYSGDPSPRHLALDDLNGKHWTLDKLKGKVTLLNIWATWCPACVHELPDLDALHLRLQRQGFQVLAIDIGEDEQSIEEFFENKNIRVNFPVLLDRNGKTVDEYQIRAFPTSFLLDKRNRIRYALIGAIKWNRPDIVNLIRKLLRE